MLHLYFLTAPVDVVFALTITIFCYIYSCQGGISMYDHIHIQREKTSLISKIQFIRQVSYGMGYLHSRDIVHKRLTTRNIFLCPNVRISVVDYGLAEVKYDRCVSRLPNRNFSDRLGKAREVAIRPEPRSSDCHLPCFQL